MYSACGCIERPEPETAAEWKAWTRLLDEHHIDCCVRAQQYHPCVVRGHGVDYAEARRRAAVLAACSLTCPVLRRAGLTDDEARDLARQMDVAL